MKSTIKTGLFDESYFNRTMGYHPIAYFPLWEAAGNTAHDIPHGNDGSYIAVTLNQPGIGDGCTCPSFDGVAGYANLQTAGLAAIFNGLLGSTMVWFKVANAGIWTDGLVHVLFLLYVDANNFITAYKNAVNNQVIYQYRAGGVTESITENGVATVDWSCLHYTWDKAGTGNFSVYRDANLTGVPQAIANNWVGALAVSLLGSTTVAPNLPWSGYIAHFALSNYVLTTTQIGNLAHV